MIALSRSKSAWRRRQPAFKPSELYKIRSSVAATLASIPLLIEAQTGLPDARPNQFLLMARRDRGQAATLKSDLGALSIVLAWAKTSGLDLHQALDRGTGLEQARLVSLVDALRIDYRKRDESNVVASS